MKYGRFGNLAHDTRDPASPLNVRVQAANPVPDHWRSRSTAPAMAASTGLSDLEFLRDPRLWIELRARRVVHMFAVDVQ
jgi:hypothetical protein